MEKEFKVSNLIKCRPEYELSDNEKDCYDILDKLDIEYERVDFNRPPESVEELEIIDKKIDVKGIKNLIFQNRNKSETYFLILPREKRIDKKSFATKYNTTRIAMVEDKVLKELLNTHPGAVSVMELIYDKDNKVKLFIDKEVLEQKYIRFHPNENKSILRIKTSDFKDKLIPYLNHEITILDLEETNDNY